MKKDICQTIYDLIGAPLRMIFLPDKISEKIGLTSLEQERISAVIPEIKGHLLDIGCGNNRLLKTYEWGGGTGIGVDVFDWGVGATIIKNSAALPFKDEYFQTVSFVACLNHIPERKEAIREAHRVLSEDGVCVVTMIDPILGEVGHRIWWYSEDKERGMEKDEVGGLWSSTIIRLFEANGFKLKFHKKFLYRMNNLYVFKKVKDSGSVIS